MSSFDYKEPIITRMRKGDSDDPFPSLTESHQIIGTIVNLSEIPYEFERVIVTGNNTTWYEKSIEDDSPLLENEYIVDYTNGLVTFHSSKNGFQLQFNFKGRGLRYVPASMVYTKSENGDVVETLKSIISDGQTAIDSLAEIKASESSRKTNETTRINNENTRISNENIRQQQESTRQADTTKAINDAISATQDAINKALLAQQKADEASINSKAAKAQADATEAKINELKGLSVVQYNDRLIEIETLTNQLKQSYDIEQIFSYVDHGIVIEHELNTYPSALVIAENTFGHSGFGVFTADEYEVKSRCEYQSINKLRLFLEESYNGTPTVVKVSTTEYRITFSNEETVLKVLLK